VSTIEITAQTMAAQAGDTRRWPLRRSLKGLLVVIDLLAVALALYVSYQLRRDQPTAPDLDGALRDHLVLGVIALPLWIGLFAKNRLYNARFVGRRVEELRRVGGSCFTAVVVMAAVGYAFQLDVSRGWLVLAGPITVAFVALERELARAAFRALRCRGRLMRSVVIVGHNDEALELSTMLVEDLALGYRVVGFVDDSGAEAGAELLGTIDQTLEVVRRTGADGVIVAASALSASITNRLVRDLLAAGIHVELSSTLRDVDADRLTVRPLGRFPVAYLEPRRTVGWRSVAKRTFDLVLAGVALVVVTPVWLAAAVAVKLDSTGPVIFRQERVGKDGELFPVWKFRTMVVDAEARLAELRDRNEADGPLFKLRDDPRVTRVGRVLRKTSLDELPQLVNVLRGEMSLVGPRPARPQELEAWDPRLLGRLRVRPGITGMWQVHGRSDSSFESYSRLDLYYVDNWSLLNDLAILAKTVPSVLFGRGAY
jgi:exopolysaccharide biosynthesis polyprenyl glycosylphosphotransferase